MPHPLDAFGASILEPSALRSSCPPWKPGAPADLELAAVLGVRTPGGLFLAVGTPGLY